MLVQIDAARNHELPVHLDTAAHVLIMSYPIAMAGSQILRMAVEYDAPKSMVQHGTTIHGLCALDKNLSQGGKPVVVCTVLPINTKQN